MPIAANIDEAIAFSSLDIAEVSYGGVLSLFTQMNLWIAGMFSEPTGIFPPSQNDQQNPGQRPVTNWLFTHLQARDSIEGPAAGDSELFSTANVTNAVVRGLSAVKDATAAGTITLVQQAAVVALYNAVWA